MSTAILYYSYSGKTRALAEAEAEKRSARLFEVKEARRYSPLGSVLFGCPAARMQKIPALLSPVPDVRRYDKVVVMAPIWAGYPAPVFNAIISSLMRGTNVDILLVSASGDSSKSKGKVLEFIEQYGLKVGAYLDIKAP